MVIVCPSCGAENPDGAEYCSLCLSTVGFVDLEYTSSELTGEGYMEEYPSSFQGEAEDTAGGYSPEEPIHPIDRVAARPVEIGAYGQASGAGVTDPYDSYGSMSASEAASRVGVTKAFDWGKALLFCLYVSLAAAALSVMLELFFGTLGLNAAMKNQETLAGLWVMAALLIPSALCGFLPGYKMEAYGWALGLITASLWFFVFRSLYYAILGWLMTGNFGIMMAFSAYSMGFVFGLFLPVAALAGWIGEKRATTGLYL